MFTDIEGSTRLLARVGDDRYHELLQAHLDIVGGAIASNGGHVHGGEGDSTFSSFRSPADAIRAALDGSLGLERREWDPGEQIRIRVGMHVGEVVMTEGGPVGLMVHMAARIGATGHGGQIVASRGVVELAGTLPDGALIAPLGRHRLKDVDEEIELVQLAHPGLDAPARPLRTLGSWAGYLPVPPSPLVGRAECLDLVDELFRSGERLVTIVGPGGIGKSRVAIEIAHRNRSDFDERVAFVSLAGITEADDVITAIASTLDLPGSSPAEVRGALSAARSLLVLDNLEQIDRAGAPVAELLAVPGVVLVTTSQRPIRHPAERLVPLEPLPGNDAVSLFRQRAERSGVAVADTDAAAVERVCDELECVPLAIELAAARLRVTPLTDLTMLLSTMLEPTSEGGRHESLPATIRWTYDLLPPAAQRAVRSLGVLRAAVSRECAVAVVGDDAILETLFDYSLLRVLPSGGIGMLESVRHFASDQLTKADEDTDALKRRDEYFVSMASEANGALRSANQLRWLDRLDLELVDLLAAIDHLRLDDVDRALTVLIDLARYWGLRGHADAAMERLDAILPEPLPAEPIMVRAAWARFGLRHPRFRDGMIDAYLQKTDHATGREAAEIFTTAELIGDKVTAARAAQVLSPLVADFERLGLGTQAKFRTRAWALIDEVRDEIDVMPRELAEPLSITQLYAGSPRRARGIESALNDARTSGDLARIAALLHERGRLQPSFSSDQRRDFTEALRLARTVGSRFLEIRVIGSFIGNVYDGPDAVDALARRWIELADVLEGEDWRRGASAVRRALEARGLDPPREVRNATEGGGLSGMAGHRLGFALRRGFSAPAHLGLWIAMGAVCAVVASTTSGIPQIALACAAGLTVGSLLFCGSRPLTTTGGPKVPWFLAVLVFGCAVGHPAVAGVLATVGGVWLAEGRRNQIVSIAIALAGLAAWGLGSPAAALVSIFVRVRWTVRPGDDAAASLVRIAAARVALVAGAVVAAGAIVERVGFERGLPQDWTTVAAIAAPAGLWLHAALMLMIHRGLAALVAAVAVGATTIALGSTTAGLLVIGISQLVAAAFLVRSGRLLTAEIYEARRLEKLSVMPPLESLAAVSTS